MFGTALIVAYSILLSYVSWRAASVPLLERHVSRKCFVAAGFVLWVVFYLAAKAEEGWFDHLPQPGAHP